MDDLGRRLRRLRQARGLTQLQLGEPLYTHAHVSTVEAGRRHPSARALEHFARKLGVEVDELATGRSAGTQAGLRVELEEVRAQIASGDPEGAGRALGRSQRKGRLQGYPELTARALELQGLIYEQQGVADRALESFEQAEVERKKVSVADAAYSVAGQIRALRALGDLHSSIFVGERFMTQLEKDGVDTPEAVVRILSPLVLAYFETGAKERAGHIAARLLSLAESVDDPGAVAAMYVNVARVQVARGEHRGAQDSLNQAERLFRQLDQANELGITILSHGIVLASQGDMRARQRLLQAVDILSGCNNAAEAGNALMELGRFERKQDDIKQALLHVDRGLALLGDDHATYRAWGLRERARCLIDIDPLLAQKSASAALELYERIDQSGELAPTHNVLGQIHRALGNESDACRSFELAAALIDPD